MIYRRKDRDNEWWVDAVLKRPGERDKRVRRRSPVQTKRGAEEYERQLLEQHLAASSTSTALEVPTLTTFAGEYLRTYAAANNRRSDVESKESVLRLHLLPALGHLRLDAIGPRDIEAYKAEKLAGDTEKDIKPLSVQSVRNHLTVLRKVLSVAQEWGIIRDVPKVRKPKEVRASFDFLTFEEAAAVLAATAPEWRAMVATGMKAGLRVGELLGLEWSAVDLKRKKLIVRQAIVRGRLGATKSGREREVPLVDSLVTELEAQPRRGPYVFSHPDGRPRHRHEANPPLWRACRTAGLREVGWHVLRHTFASHLAMRGVSLKVIQELLGHSTITVTMRYAHLSPESHAAAVALLDAPPPR